MVEALYSLGDAARINTGAENYIARGIHLMWWVVHKELLERALESKVGDAMILARGYVADGHQRRV